MAKHVCPYWVGYWLLNPFRGLIQNPDKILAPYVASGMTVLDIGSAMGFFSLPLARMVGPEGKVICVDVQEKMLDVLQHRAQKAQLAERIVARVCEPTSLGLDDFYGQIDFALSFAVVHEVSDVSNFFIEVCLLLKPKAFCLVVEPKGHVSAQDFEETLDSAKHAGMSLVSRPPITWSRTALLRKDEQHI
jgi:2-polyprenyl-3-methyl-5-hydroxy-6-metoxy-1,4-benzoquinol methylase